jgi:hypothetical protein
MLVCRKGQATSDRSAAIEFLSRRAEALPVASQKQIAANRENAKRSTGPRTRAGKKRSSKNSRKHGLSLELDEILADEAAQLARAISATIGVDPIHCGDFARAGVAVERVRRVKTRLICHPDLMTNPAVTRNLLSLKRYELRATAALRRASKNCRAVGGLNNPLPTCDKPDRGVLR